MNNNKEEKEILEHLSLLEPNQANTPKPASQALAQVQARVREEQKMSWQYRFSKLRFSRFSFGKTVFGRLTSTSLASANLASESCALTHLDLANELAKLAFAI